MAALYRVAESVAPLHRRCEPSKDLVSQSLSSKLTSEREMAQKALGLLLTAQSAFEREAFHVITKERLDGLRF